MSNVEIDLDQARDMPKDDSIDLDFSIIEIVPNSSSGIEISKARKEHYTVLRYEDKVIQIPKEFVKVNVSLDIDIISFLNWLKSQYSEKELKDMFSPKRTML